MALEYCSEIDGTRYWDNLLHVLEKIGGKKVLYLNFENSWQGFVDVDVLCEDGKVFSYKYYYGSCSGCDNWEAEEYNDEQIENIMLQEATIFDNEADYQKWQEKAGPSRRREFEN